MHAYSLVTFDVFEEVLNDAVGDDVSDVFCVHQCLERDTNDLVICFV